MSRCGTPGHPARSKDGLKPRAARGGVLRWVGPNSARNPASASKRARSRLVAAINLDKGARPPLALPHESDNVMGAAFPKRQHVVPRMLLNRFCDENGWLWVGVRDRTDMFRQRPERAFIQNHIYTRYAYDGALPSAEHEEALGNLENDAAPVISRLVGRARRIEPPEPSPTEIMALQRFVFSLACRTPESQQRMSRGLSDDDFYNIVRERAEQEGFEGLPDRHDFYADSKIRELAKRIRHNADASFAAGVDPHLAAEESKFTAETGVRFAVIHESDKSFAIGSHGITNCDLRLVGGYLAGAVLPIAHDVLAHITPWPCTPGLVVLDDTAGSCKLIDTVNAATAAQSAMIAGGSQALIRSLLD